MRSKYIRRNDLVEVHEDARETSKEEVLRLTNWSTAVDRLLRPRRRLLRSPGLGEIYRWIGRSAAEPSPDTSHCEVASPLFQVGLR